MQIIGLQQRTYCTLDEILKDIPETATEELSDIEETYQSYKEELNQELKTTDRVWIEFQAGQCEKYGKFAKSILYRIVNSSIGCPENSVAAANAITILKVMKVSFSCLDFQGVQIPKADLSGAILDRTDLSYANLENVNLTYASLNSTNMAQANLKKVQFNIPDTFIHESKILSSIVSPDNKYLVSEDIAYIYFWHIPNKTCIKKIDKSDNYIYSKLNKIFTPDGQFLLIHDGRQNIDIWAIADFRYVKTLKIFEEEAENVSFSFSPDGDCLVIKYSLKDKTDTHVKSFEIQKTTNNHFNIKLKSKFITKDSLGNICFSKILPVFYCLQFDSMSPDSKIRLSIRELGILSEVASTDIDAKQVYVDFIEKTKFDAGLDRIIELFSLDILDVSNINKNNEEHLFITKGNSISIYVFKILKKNGQIPSLELFEKRNILTEIDIIYGMKILARTHQIIYLCNDTICFYGFWDNRLIGKYRLSDMQLQQFSTTPDQKNIYINSSNKVSIHSIQALENNRYNSYVLDCAVSCFSHNNYILSLSKNYYKQTYDIQTGSLLQTDYLKKIKSSLASKSIEPDILHTLSNDHIFVNNRIIIPELGFMGVSPIYKLTVMNTLDGKVVLGDIQNYGVSALYKKYFENFSDSDNELLTYFAILLNPQNKLAIYKTISYRQEGIPQFDSGSIGQFDISSYRRLEETKLALSINFHYNPKIALVTHNTVTIFNLRFDDKELKLVSEKEIGAAFTGIIHICFDKKNNTLTIVCKEKIILLNIEDESSEEYNIQANCADISNDGSLLIFYNRESSNFEATVAQLCLWSVTQKKPLIIQTFSLVITKVQISPDNRYIIGTTESGGIYVWEVLGETFRLLWNTVCSLQAQGLILSDNNLEKGVVEKLNGYSAKKLDKTIEDLAQKLAETYIRALSVKNKASSLIEANDPLKHICSTIKSVLECDEQVVQEGEYYIELDGKESELDQTHRPLSSMVQEFIDSDYNTLVINGEAGAGKTLFAKFETLKQLQGYKTDGYLFVYVSLPQIENPFENLIEKVLKTYGIDISKDPKLAEEMKNRKIVWFFDEFDNILFKNESEKQKQINQFGEWKNSKFIFTCKNSVYHQLDSQVFEPQNGKKRVIYTASFTSKKMRKYLKKLVKVNELKSARGDKSSDILWNYDRYRQVIDELCKIPNMAEHILSNPLFLKIASYVMPYIEKKHAARARHGEDISVSIWNLFLKSLVEIKTNLYDAYACMIAVRSHAKFVDHVQKFEELKELGSKGISAKQIEELKELMPEDFLDYSVKVAMAMKRAKVLWVEWSALESVEETDNIKLGATNISASLQDKEEKIKKELEERIKEKERVKGFFEPLFTEKGVNSHGKNNIKNYYFKKECLVMRDGKWSFRHNEIYTYYRTLGEALGGAALKRVKKLITDDVFKFTDILIKMEHKSFDIATLPFLKVQENVIKPFENDDLMFRTIGAIKEALKNDEQLSSEASYYIPLKGRDENNIKNIRHLSDRIDGFLQDENEDKKMLVMIGNPGSGKSLFVKNYAYTKLTNQNIPDGFLPIHVYLPSFKKSFLSKKLLEDVLEKFGVNIKSDLELNTFYKRKILWILDGYDKIAFEGNQKIALNNAINFEKWVNSKFLITCRTEGFDQIGLSKFKIRENEKPEVVYILEFDLSDTKEYFKQFIEVYKKVNANFSWIYKDYLDVIKILETIDYARNKLLKNPSMVKILAYTIPLMIAHDKENYVDDSTLKADVMKVFYGDSNIIDSRIKHTMAAFIAESSYHSCKSIENINEEAFKPKDFLKYTSEFAFNLRRYNMTGCKWPIPEDVKMNDSAKAFFSKVLDENIKSNIIYKTECLSYRNDEWTLKHDELLHYYARLVGGIDGDDYEIIVETLRKSKPFQRNYKNVYGNQ